MGKKSSRKITLNIDVVDKEFYNTLMDSKLFDKNLNLFLISVFIGKYVLNSSKKIESSVSYIRINDTLHYDDMTLLKCWGIEEEDNLDILKSEEEIFKKAEQYARVGVKQLYDWYLSKNDDLNIKLAELLLDKFEQLDFNVD